MYRELKSDPTLSKVAVLVTTSDPSRAPAGVLLMKKPVDLNILISTVARCCDQPINAAF